jgi:hypothetical protein
MPGSRGCCKWPCRRRIADLGLFAAHLISASAEISSVGSGGSALASCHPAVAMPLVWAA